VVVVVVVVVEVVLVVVALQLVITCAVSDTSRRSRTVPPGRV
jgi:hypothetical protein